MSHCGSGLSRRASREYQVFHWASRRQSQILASTAPGDILRGLSVWRTYRPLSPLRSPLWLLTRWHDLLDHVVTLDAQRSTATVQSGRCKCRHQRPCFVRIEGDVIVLVGDGQGFLAINGLCDFCAQEEGYVIGTV
jgi:hypothetical protein